QTGNEASVDRLMKQIPSFMSEISVEFKIIVIDAVRSLCLKFPSKQTLMLNFLSSEVRDNDGYEYKRAIIEAIFDIMYHIPESKEYALSHLCEIIEDCEFTKLAVRILHLLGSEGPKSATPSKFIRHIYNRVILENATVRAAAVSALARFAVHNVELRERIKVLLTRCLDDSEDEVRDRSAMFLRILENEQLCRQYIANETVFTWASLERNLVIYLNDPAQHTAPFDISATPIVTQAEEAAARSPRTAAADITSPTLQAPSASASGAGASSSAGRAAPSGPEAHTAAMERIPELAVLGNIFKSSNPVQLTESETEYGVTCIKHVFPQHVVFQFNCKNTLNDMVLENVTVEMAIVTSDDEDTELLRPERVIPIQSLVHDIPGVVYVVYGRPNGISPTATFSTTMKFIAKECDPSTGEAEEEGVEDEYPLEDIDLVRADYMLPTFVADFTRVWDEVGSAYEVVETYSLTNVASIKAAVSNTIECLGMSPAESTNAVKDQAATHGLLLAGTYAGGVPVVARCRFAFSPASGVTMELSVRSDSAAVSEKVANAIS
ncbi:coatomer gamma subunit appendage platform subdomain-containing protein, partial [Blyttiomyces helicus]